MKYYAGPQSGDERPKGGGRYNKENIGHEVFNFAEFDGRLYGYAAASINLKRIDPIAGAANKLEDVLLIFVARQHIVGWYRDATVYPSARPKFPASVTKEMLRRLKQSSTGASSLLVIASRPQSKTALHCYRRMSANMRFPVMLRAVSAIEMSAIPIATAARGTTQRG